MKKFIACLLLLSLALLCISCGDSSWEAEVDVDKEIGQAQKENNLPSKENMFTDRDQTDTFDETNTTSITLTGDSATITGAGGIYSDGVVTINRGGTYLVSGTLTQGQLVVDVESTQHVQLVLDGVSIHHSTHAPLYVRRAEKVVVTLVGDNTLTGGDTFTQTDENNVDGVLYSQDDLTINGTGSLTIPSSAGHGIVTKDDLVVMGGTYTITATKQGLSANDSIRISNGTFHLDTGGDCIHAENQENTTLGFVYIEAGTFHLTSDGDAISASSALQICGGSITCVTGGGSANSSSSSGSGWWGDWGNTSTESDVSAKGLKAQTSLIIEGGTFQLDTADDAIHANDSLYVRGGTFTLSSGDDGLHADSAVNLYDGSLTISKSYEGIEAKQITIYGGTHRVVASDDGLNAGGGADGSALGRPGAGGFEEAESDTFLRILGGTLVVNATGDGLDSNGALYVTGGETYVSGPTNSGNGALDYAGEATITGGILFAAGSTGMAQNFGTTSTQGSCLVSTGTISANTTMTVSDEDGNILATFTPEKQFGCVVISLPEMEVGATLTLTVGTTSTTITLTSLIMGSGSGAPGGPGGGGPTRPGGGRW